MKGILSWWVVTGLAACAANPPPGDSAGGEASGPRVRQVPAQVGEFRQIDVHPFPQPGAGIGYRYSDDSPLRPDVYVYPVPPSGSDAESSLVRAQTEGRLLLSALQVERDRGRFDSFQLLSDSVITLGVPGNSLEGSHVSVLLTRRGDEAESHQHIFVLGDQFVKIRTTFPRGSQSLSRLEDFIEALLTGMTAAQQPEPEVAARH
jgi:hypothetical protein